MRLSIRLMIVRILSLCFAVVLTIAPSPIAASAHAGSVQAPAPQPQPAPTPATVTPEQPETPPPAPAPRPWGQMRFGSIWLTPGVALKEIGIDTNVFNTSAADERRTDFTFTGGPQLSVLFDRRKLRIEALGGVDYVYFLKNADQRYVAATGTATATLQMSRRFQLTAGASSAATRQRFTPEIDLRAKNRGGSVSMGASVGLASRVSLQLRGSASERRFDAGAIYNNIPLSQTLNEDTLSSGASLALQLTPWTSFSIGGTASAHRFPLMPSRDADAEESFLRVDLNARALISGTAQIGHVNYVTRGAGIEDFKGITATGTVGSRLGDSTDVRLLFYRDVGLSYDPRVPFLLDREVGGVVQRMLFSRVALRLEAHRHKYEYLGWVRLDPGEQPPTDEWLERYIAAFDVRTAGDFRLSFNSEYSHRATARQVRSYEGFRFWTSFAYGRFTVKERNAPIPPP
jgi:hypothetical protein